MTWNKSNRIWQAEKGSWNKIPNLGFSARYGIDDTGLILWLDANNPKSWDTPSLWKDSSLNIDIEQLTSSKQPTIVRHFLNGERTFDGANYYMQQEVLEDDTGSTFIYGANVSGTTAFVYTDIDFTNFVGKKVVLYDGTYYAWGYIDSVGSGLAKGGELIPNGDMELDSNWNNYQTPTVNERSATQKHGGSYSRKFTSDSVSDGIKSDTFTTVTGGLYYFDCYVYPDDSTKIRTAIRKGDNGGFLSDVNNTSATQDAWNQSDRYVTETAGGAGAYVISHSSTDTSGDWYNDDFSYKQVTDIPATQGAHVTQTVGGTVGWNLQNAAFDFNAIQSFEIVEPLGISDAMTLFVVLKPDDGQPASNEVLFSKYISSDGLRSLALEVITTGKLVAWFSSDGNNNTENETTDSAFYSDGAQSDWSSLGVVYDGSGGTIKIYGNGVLLASTTGVGGVPASIFDAPSKLTIGGLSNGTSLFAGKIKLVTLHNRALSASEIETLHKETKKW